jgi:hypothetical protein
MIRQRTALAVLTELNLQDVFFPNESDAEREEHSKRIIKYIAFRAGRNDSQSWIGIMDGEKTMPEILGDILFMFNWERPYEPFQLSPYDQVFTDMALVEGATGLDLTSYKKRSYAMMTYLHGVKSTIVLFKKMYDVRKEDAARLEVPPLVPEISVDSPDVENEAEGTQLSFGLSG